MMKRKNNNYMFWHSPLALVLLLFVLFFFGYKIIDLIKKERETSHKKEVILDQINDLKQRETSLSEDISRINTEEGKEEIIREKYQVAKEGEKMVIIVDDSSIQGSISSQKEENHGFWNWFKHVFNK